MRSDASCTHLLSRPSWPFRREGRIQERSQEGFDSDQVHATALLVCHAVQRSGVPRIRHGCQIGVDFATAEIETTTSRQRPLPSSSCRLTRGRLAEIEQRDMERSESTTTLVRTTIALSARGRSDVSSSKDRPNSSHPPPCSLPDPSPSSAPSRPRPCPRTRSVSSVPPVRVPALLKTGSFFGQSRRNRTALVAPPQDEPPRH